MRVGGHVEDNRHILGADNVLEEASALVLGQRYQRGTLCGVGGVVDHQNRLSGIRISVRIAQRRASTDGGSNSKAVKLNAIPPSLIHVPGHERKVSGESHLPVGETLCGVNVGGAGLDIVAAKLLGLR